MTRRILLLTLLMPAFLVVDTSARAQRQNGQVVRLRIQKVTENGVLPHTVQGEPDVIGFSCASAVADSEPTCYVLLRDRVF